VRVKTVIPKVEARKIVLQRRREISEGDIRQKTDRIINRLKNLDEFVEAKTVHCYISSRQGEVNTRMLINLMESWGKSIIVPKLNTATKTFWRGTFRGWHDLVLNDEGYFEPNAGLDDNLHDIDLIIVPAVAVSIHGHRIGYGGGYYDKLLKNFHAPKFVLAFEFQLFDAIESTPSDVRVDKIVTELRVINTLNQSRF